MFTFLIFMFLYAFLSMLCFWIYCNEVCDVESEFWQYILNTAAPVPFIQFKMKSCWKKYI